MTIRYQNEAKRNLRVMDHVNISRIESRLKKLPEGDILPMYDGTYRLRVGKYRVIFEYVGNIAVVHRIASRGDVYKGINC